MKEAKKNKTTDLKFATFDTTHVSLDGSLKFLLQIRKSIDE
jgi:hypothetical protein